MTDPNFRKGLAYVLPHTLVAALFAVGFLLAYGNPWSTGSFGLRTILDRLAASRSQRRT